MGEKIPKFYGYVVVLLVLAIGAVLVWNYMLGPKREPSGLTASPQEGSEELAGKERQIHALDDQIAQLRKELEASSNKVAELEARLDRVIKTLSSTRQRMTTAVRPAERSFPTSPPPEEKVASKAAEPSAAPSWRRPAEPGNYEVVRPTGVFAEPSDTSRKLSTIKRGTRVAVVGSVGEWLEVRSKHGNPPGFIRRDDAMFVEKQD